MQPKRMRAPRPVNPSINPNRSYSPAAPTAPLIGGDFQSAAQARMNALRYRSLFDIGVNPAIAADVRERHGLNDEDWRQVSETIGTVVGAGIGFAKGITVTTPMYQAGAGMFAGGPVGIVGGVATIVGATILLAGYTISGAYTGRFVGGLATPSGIHAAGELIRDVVVGVQTDWKGTGAYLVTNLVIHTATDAILKKFKLSNKWTRRLVSQMVAQLSTQKIMTLTKLMDDVDPNRVSIMELSGNTMSQLSNTNALRAILTGAANQEDDIMENIKLAYGISDEGYRPYYFSDIRSGLNIDLGLFPNQMIDFIGNTLTDTTFWTENLEHYNRKKATKRVEDSYEGEYTEAPDYNSMTVKQLKDIAKQNGLKGYTGMNKDALIQFLTANVKDSAETLVNNLLNDPKLGEQYRKAFANFIINNVTKLDSRDTYNQFLLFVLSDSSLMHIFKDLNDLEKTNLYRMVIDKGVQGLTDKDLKYYVDLKQNKEAAKGITKVIQKGELNNLLHNELAALNFRGFGMHLNANVAKYTALSNYNKMFNHISSAVGWLNPINKVIGFVQTIPGRLEKLQKKNSELLKVENGKVVLNEQAVMKYMENLTSSVQKGKESITKLTDQIKEQYMHEELRIKAEYKEKIITLEKEIVKIEEAIAAQEAAIKELEDTLNYKTYIGNTNKYINAANLEVYKARLTKLKQSAQTDEVKAEIDELEGAIDNYQFNRTEKFVTAEVKYTINRLKASGELVKSMYNVMSHTIEIDFEERDPDDKIFKLFKEAKYRAQQDVINLSRGALDVESSKIVWEVFKDNIYDNNSKKFTSLKDFQNSNQYLALSELEQQWVDYLFNNRSKYIDEHGEFFETETPINYRDAKNYQRKLYIQQRIKELSDNGESMLAMTLELIKKDIQDFLNNFDIYSEDNPFSLISDEDVRQHAINEYNNIVEKFSNGYLGMIMDGMDQVFNYKDRFYKFSDLFKLDILKNIRDGVKYDGTTTDLSNELSKNNTEIGFRQKLITQSNSFIKLLSDPKDHTLLYRYINYLETGNEASLFESIRDYNEYKRLDDNNHRNPNEEFIYNIYLETIFDRLRTIFKNDDIFNIQPDISMDLLKQNSNYLEKQLVKQQEQELTEQIPEPKVKIAPLATRKENLAKILGNSKVVLEKVGLEKIFENEDFQKGLPIFTAMWNAVQDKRSASPGYKITPIESTNIKNTLAIGLNISPEMLDNYTLEQLLTITDNLETLLKRYDSIERPKDDTDENTYPDSQGMLEDDLKNFLLMLDDNILINVLNIDPNEKITYDHIRDNIDKFDNLLEQLEDMPKKITILSKVVGGKPANIINEFANREMSVQTLIGGDIDTSTTTFIDFLFQYGSKADFEEFKTTLAKVYGDEVKFKVNNKTVTVNVADATKEQIKQMIDNAHILNRQYKAAYHEMNNLRRRIARDFEGVKMQNNIPILELASDDRALGMLNHLHQVLNLETLLDTNHKYSYLNYLITKSSNSVSYMKDFKVELSNMVFKLGFINEYSNTNNLTQEEKLIFLDLLDQVNNIKELFTVSTDGSMAYSNSYVRKRINELLDSEAYDKPFLKPILNTIMSMRDDIKTNGVKSPYANRNFNQEYNRHFVDKVKSTLYQSFNLFKEVIESQENYYGFFDKEEWRHDNKDIELEDILPDVYGIYKEKKTEVGNIIMDLNYPLSRQANRNDWLIDHLMTKQAFHKTVYQTPINYSIDIEEFIKHNPGILIPGVNWVSELTSDLKNLIINSSELGLKLKEEVDRAKKEYYTKEKHDTSIEYNIRRNNYNRAMYNLNYFIEEEYQQIYTKIDSLLKELNELLLPENIVSTGSKIYNVHQDRIDEINKQLKIYGYTENKQINGTHKLSSKDAKMLNNLINNGFTKNSELWLLSDEVNYRTLIEIGSAITYRRSTEVRTASRAKRLFNTYIDPDQKKDVIKQIKKTPYKYAATYGYDPIKDKHGIIYMRKLDDNVKRILDYTSLSRNDKILSNGKTRINMEGAYLYMESLEYFSKMGTSHPEYIAALKYYELHQNEIGANQNVINALKLPDDTAFASAKNDNPSLLELQVRWSGLKILEDDIIKAALARAHYSQSYPIEYSENDYLNQLDIKEKALIKLDEAKVTLEKLKGSPKVGLKDSYKDTPFKVHEVLYNIIDNNLPEGELDNYVSELGMVLTDQDREYIEERKALNEKLYDKDTPAEEKVLILEQLKLDYKNPPPIIKEILNYQKGEAIQIAQELSKINDYYIPLLEDLEEQLSQATSQEDIDRIEQEIYSLRTARWHASEKIRSKLPEDYDLDSFTDFEDVSEWEDGELNILKNKIRDLRNEQKVLLEELRNRKNEELEKIRVENSSLDTAKYNQIKNDIMDAIKTGDVSDLISTLNNTYPGMGELIEAKVNDILAKYNTEKEKAKTTRTKIVYRKEKVVTSDDSEVIEIDVPDTIQVRDLAYLDRILRNPYISPEIKYRFLTGDLDLLDPDAKIIPMKEQLKTEEKILDKSTIDVLKEIFGHDEYAEIAGEFDPYYQNELDRIEYLLQDELFDLIVTLEDEMWNIGVDNKTPEMHAYESQYSRMYQLSNYYSATFAEVVDLFTVDGNLDTDVFLKHIINNPQIKVVGIFKDDTGKARDYKIRTIDKDGNYITEEIPADGETPVIKELPIGNKEDIEYVLEQVEEGFQVGIMTEDNFNIANRVSYKPYKLPKGLDIAYNMFVKTQKMSAIFDTAFVPQVFIDTIIKNSVAYPGQLGDDMALQLGVKTMRYYYAWNTLQSEKIVDMQSILQLQYDVANGDQAAIEKFNAIRAHLLQEAHNNPSNEKLNALAGSLKYTKTKDQQIKILYFYINNMVVADYVETSMYQNALFSKNQNDVDRRQNISKNFMNGIDKEMLSRVGMFMKANAVGAEQNKVRKAMEGFMNKNPNLQVSEEHMRWLYFQNPEAYNSKSFLNPNNLSTFHISAARSINTIGKLHGFLLGNHLYGDNVEQGLARAMRTHFSYKPQSRTDILSQFIFPYMNVASHNMMFWDNQFNSMRTQRIMYNLTISAWGAWQEKYDPERENAYAESLMYRGMIPIGEHDFLKISPQRSIYKNFDLVQNPDKMMQYRLNPLISTAIAQLKGESPDWKQAVPFVGRISQYFGEMEDRQGLSKYAPSLFGYMQTQQTRRPQFIPYRNVYRQLYTTAGKYRTPSTNPLQTVRNIQYRMQERRYMK